MFCKFRHSARPKGQHGLEYSYCYLIIQSNQKLYEFFMKKLEMHWLLFVSFFIMAKG